MQRLRLAALCLALFAAGPAWAEDAYPSRPITMIIPFPPGGVADQTARAIIAPLEKELKAAIAIRCISASVSAGMSAGISSSERSSTLILPLPLELFRPFSGGSGQAS